MVVIIVGMSRARFRHGPLPKPGATIQLPRKRKRGKRKRKRGKRKRGRGRSEMIREW